MTERSSQAADTEAGAAITMGELRENWRSLRAWLRSDAAPRWILFAIIVVAALLRLTNLNWDDFTHIHPDERFLTMVTAAMRLPDSIGQFFDSTQSPMNPYNIGYDFFVYGTLPLFIVRVAAEFAQKINEALQLWSTASGVPLVLTGFDGIHLVGRFVSGLFDVGCVWLAYLIARRLYSVRVGLLAAALYAFSVLPLQQSHFYTVDTFGTFFALVTFYFCVRVSQGGGWWHYVAMGVGLGAALASRINLAPLAAIGLLAAAIHVWDEISAQRARAAAGAVEDKGWLGLLVQATLFRLALFGVAAIVVFRMTQPYAFGGTTLLSFTLGDKFRESMRQIQALISGAADYPPGHQWTARTPFVFPFVNMVVWGLGVFLGAAGWLGWLVAAFQILRTFTLKGIRLAPDVRALADVRGHLLPVAWVGGMFLWQGLQFVQSMRYLLPTYALLAVLAAWLLWWLVDRAQAYRAERALAAATPAGTRPAGRVQALWRRVLTVPVAYGLMTVVVIATMLWGWGFLAIYRRPLSRITASEWLYANAPKDSVLANEHWDDPLPFSRDGKIAYGGQGYFRSLTSSNDGVMQMYWEDTPEKREALYKWLDEADYIVQSSNRLWGSIPRLPMRFPMSTEFYRLLAEGKLGFELVQRVTSFPTIFGIQFDDTQAEEAFSVYDHPEVRIYKKTPAYSEALLRSYFDQVDLGNTIQMWPRMASSAPTALLMTEKEYSAQQAGGTWSDIFNLDSLVNRSPVVAVLVWVFLLILLGIVAFPITFVVLRKLSDRGYGVAKMLGLLVLAWLSWFAPALKVASYTRAWIALCLGLMIGLSAVIAWRRWGMIREFIRERKTLLIVEEGVFLFVFLLFLLVRIGNPDLWSAARGGEKPMEFAYLNAIIRSTVFPPYDPWHAGGYMNYYYFGWVIVGTLIKLTGIVPWVAFNLAVPTFAGLTGVGAFSIAYNLADRDWATRLAGDAKPGARVALGSLLAGFAGVFFITIIGNLGNVKLLLDRFAERGTVVVDSSIPGFAKLVTALSGIANVVTNKTTLDFPNDWWFWNASRIIPDTINEFPFFTFIFADLHPHLIALPLTLLALAAVVSLALLVPRREAGSSEPSPWAIALPELFTIVLLGFVIGALRATNTWDFPTYALASLIGLVVLEITRRGPILAAQRPDGIQAWLAFGLRSVVSVLWRFVVLFAVGAVAFYPFTSHYATAYAGLERYKEAKTLISDYLTHWGFFIALAVFYLITEFVAQRRRRRLAPWLGDAFPFVGGMVVVLVLVGWVLGVRVWLVALPLAAAAVLLALGRDLPPARRTALLLLALALAITIGVEVVRQKDDIGRMNTVFKFGLQAWTLFAVSLAFGFAAFVGRTVGRRSLAVKVAWVLLAVLFLGTMLYPPFAARAKMRDRFSAEASPRGLDGMAYMDKAQYFDNGQDLLLADDKAAILWLLQNVQGSPTILEAQIPEYRWGSRFSVYTGLPTVQGWNWHQRQQRSIVPSAEVERRVSDVAEIYNTVDLARARQLLDRYGVRYLIVGQEERAYYAPDGLAKFPTLESEGYLRTVYQQGAVTIYEIVGANRAPNESYAYFLNPRFGSAAGDDTGTFISPKTFESPARQ